MINVSAALCVDTALVLTVKRPVYGTQLLVDGIHTPPPYETFTALISPQQPSYKELQVLPAGERDKDIFLFVSNKELYTASDRDQRLADMVVFKGNDYKIIYSGDWNLYGHTSAMGVRERENATT